MPDYSPRVGPQTMTRLPNSVVKNHVLRTDAPCWETADINKDGTPVGRVDTRQLLDLLEFALTPPAVVGPSGENPAAEADVNYLLLRGGTLRRSEVRTPHTSHLGTLEPADEALDPAIGHDDVIIGEENQLRLNRIQRDVAGISPCARARVVDEANPSRFGLLSAWILARTHHHHLERAVVGLG